jgi:hypothetical protein
MAKALLLLILLFDFPRSLTRVYFFPRAVAVAFMRGQEEEEKRMPILGCERK